MNLKDYFKKAQKEGWAIGQFNVSNLETLRAVVLAAQNLKSPVIVGTSEGESKFLGLKQAAVLVRVFREETGLPIFLDLDHGKSLEYIRGAIEAGYDAVHFDGSQLPLEENIRITKEVVKLARK
ncbi:MAG: class II fructose-bisphosphate aldolase, partial [bacterium]